MLGRRLGTAFVAGPFVVAAVLLGDPTFVSLIALAAFVAAGESARLIERSAGRDPNSYVERFGAVLIVLAAAAGASAVLATISLVIGLYLGLSLTSLGAVSPRFSWSDRFAATLYVAVPLSLIVLMRGWIGSDVQLFGPAIPPVSVPYGVAWVSVILSITWVVDSAAFFVGRAIGRRLFSPSISPNKTWEGTIAGIVGGTVVGILWAPAFHWAPALGLCLGFVTSGAAVLGDLVESALKRRAGLKDTGSILPGHGGILDRIDSLAFSAIVVFLVGTLDETTHVLSLGT